MNEKIMKFLCWIAIVIFIVLYQFKSDIMYCASSSVFYIIYVDDLG